MSDDQIISLAIRLRREFTNVLIVECYPLTISWEGSEDPALGKFRHL
jgi:hypothetical protein